MKVKCVRLKDRQTGKPKKSSSSLTVGKIYHVFSISVEFEDIPQYRIPSDDYDSPSLHKADQFEIYSDIIPSNWCAKLTGNSLLTIEPRAWSHDGFWEEYFNKDAKSTEIFEEEKLKIIAEDP